MKTSVLLKSALLSAAFYLAPAAVLMTVAPEVGAQPLRYLGCDELWYERNSIYARNGYCFKTPRAQQAFGRGCFPPYGRLTGWEKERVARIEEWEYRKGCR